MLYTSPFEILNLTGSELQQLDKRQLTLKKKQLLAELELQHTNTILLQGKEFTKNDILNLFEQLEQGGSIEYHAAIAADPVLLRLLQTGTIKERDRFNGNPLYQDSSFVAFVSPYYKTVFNQYVLKALAASDHGTIGAIFNNPLLLSGADYDDCLGRLHGYLNEKLHNITLLKNSFAANSRINLAGLHDYYVYPRILTLNKLPDEFASFREDYAIELYNFVIDLWNSKRKDDATALLYGIQDIKTEGEVKQLIKDLAAKVAEAGAAAAGSSGRSSDGSSVSTGRIVWAVIVFIFMIIRIGTTCSRNSSYNERDYSKIFTQVNDLKFGYPEFNPTTARDSAFAALLSTLQYSTGPEYKVKKTAALKTGDDPYKTVFSKPIFKPDTSGETLIDVGELPRMVPDTDEEINTVVTEGEKAEPQAGINPKITLYNNLNLETIFFFISSKQVFSVYVAPKGRHTVTINPGYWHVFGYGGEKFAQGLPLNFSAAETGAYKKTLSGAGRFAVINSKMLECLKPENNICFTARTVYETGSNSSIIADFNNDEHFRLLSGSGISVSRVYKPVIRNRYQ